LRVVTVEGGMSAVVQAAVGTPFFGVRVVSLGLWTTLKPSSWVAADLSILGWPTGVLAFSTDLNSCRATMCVPYRVLNRVFPLRALPVVLHCTDDG
jgi:hypothetical protein